MHWIEFRFKHGHNTVCPPKKSYQDNSPWDDSHLTTPPEHDSPARTFPRNVMSQRIFKPENVSPGLSTPPLVSTHPELMHNNSRYIIMINTGQESCGPLVLQGTWSCGKIILRGRDLLGGSCPAGSRPPGETSSGGVVKSGGVVTALSCQMGVIFTIQWSLNPVGYHILCEINIGHIKRTKVNLKGWLDLTN